MSYVEKIEAVLDNGGTAEQIGIEVASIINDENLSYGELATIEDELNKVGASMYEDRYNELRSN